ncbi:MAG: hypothetical protein HY429_01855 [Candidatus Levybacteria bacterium]|nr:hypothetical protein [Candidatus Levybacteria bacterium]
MDKQPEREPQPRTTEIIHSPNFTVLINPSVSHRQDVRELVEEVKNGIPSSWLAREDPSWRRDIAREVDPDYGQWIDNENRPRFFAKTRTMGMPTWVAYAKKMERGDVSDFGFSRRAHYAFASLLNEINLSPKIKAALNHKEVKELAVKYGMEEITFIEPLIGLINKVTGQKIMVYDFIDAQPFSTKTTGLPYKEASSFVLQLNYILEDKSGTINEELGGAQLMVDKVNPKKLYLIDIEGYHAVPKHSE